jgi:hypothetical protein
MSSSTVQAIIFLDCDGVLAGSRVQSATADDRSLVHAPASLKVKFTGLTQNSLVDPAV